MVFGKKHESESERRAAEQQKLGAMIESMYDTVRPDRGALYRTAFLKGVISGVGGIIGATVVIALIAWLLSLFTEVPILGHFVESVRHTLETHK
jgi:branched-subunit amino acid ABC-type transport system permease component